MSDTPSSTTAAADHHQGSRPQGERANKQALLKALASELRKEKIRSEKLAIEVDKVEEKVNTQHDILVETQTSLTHLRDQNDTTIASLRSELKKLRQSLDAATACDEFEAAAYLALIDGRRENSPASALYLDLGEPFPSGARGAGGGGGVGGGGALPSVRPRSPARVRGSPVQQALPMGNAEERAKLRIRKLDEQLEEKARVSQIQPRSTNNSNYNPTTGTTTMFPRQKGQSYISDTDSETKGGLDGLGLSGGGGGGAGGGGVVERSEWRDSIDEVGERPLYGGETGLGRKSTWSRIFPGAYGKK